MRGMRSFGAVRFCSGGDFSHIRGFFAQDDGTEERVASQTWMRNRVRVFLSNEIGGWYGGLSLQALHVIMIFLKKHQPLWLVLFL